MVLLEYLQRPLHHVSTDDSIQLASSNLDKGYAQNEDPHSLSSGWVLGPAARVLRRVNSTVQSLRDGLTDQERSENARKEERRQILALRMKNALTMEAWQSAARELDALEGNEKWKAEATSDEFDVLLIERRLAQLDTARANRDIKAMLYLVRTALSRDLGGMGNIRLYKHSHIGTKDLIERYIDSTLDTIRSLVETSKFGLPEGIETKDVLEQVVYARQAFGRSALLLSGGATFGMNHIGVLKALFDAKLLPRIISGASAGSIVCAVLCTRTDAEIPEVLEAFPYGDLAVFEEDGNEDGVLERMKRLLTQGSWIDIKHLTRVMQQLLGDMTFQEAYNRTRRILNICVSSASVYELPRLLNYITSPNVMIWSAVAASCSVPFLFSAAELLVKNPITGENTPWNPTPQRWIDGSVDNDLPMTRLAEMFNVNHFIVSQVNPHVVPFLVKDEEAITNAAQSSSDSPGWVYTLTNLAKDEALHRMHVLADLGIFPNLVTKCRSVLSQKYSGDITILPQIEYKDFPRILKNPTSDFMVQACLCGERATWPKLSRIRNHCAVELELDAAVQQLRAKVVFSPSQVDLRRMTTGSYRSPIKGKKRRDSENASPPSILDGTVESPKSASKKFSRPQLRTTSSHWAASATKRYLPPLTLPNSRTRSAHASPLPTPRIIDSPVFRKNTPLNLQIPDMSSAGDTTQYDASEDADVDSHTDDSTPDPETSIVGLGLGEEEDGEVDFFSSSQPVRSGTDRVMATSPIGLRSRAGTAVSMDFGPIKRSATDPCEERSKRL